MINMTAFEALKKLPAEHPFEGLTLVTITERPLIKVLAQLCHFWIPLRRAMALIKEVSAEQDFECGTTMYFDKIHPGATWAIVDARAKKGELVYVKAICCVPAKNNPVAERLCIDFGIEMMNQFHAATKAMEHTTVLVV